MPRGIGITSTTNWIKAYRAPEGSRIIVDLPWDDDPDFIVLDPRFTSLRITHALLGWIGTAGRGGVELFLCPGDIPQAAIPVEVAERGLYLPVSVLVPFRQSFSMWLSGSGEVGFWVVLSGVFSLGYKET